VLLVWQDAHDNEWLVNAATGPVKNRVPNRLMHRSNRAVGKGCDCASPC
jgi:hypothetical protein